MIRSLSARLAVAAGAVCCLGGVAGALALAASGGGSGTTELGPFHGSGIPIGGSCGNTWGTLNDNTTRYSVYPPNRDGTTTAVQTVGGMLTTLAGKSPGACNGGPDNGKTIGAGIRVKLYATEMETISGGIFNPHATCAAQCFTGAFVPAFFGATATVAPDYSFEDWMTRCNGRYITLFQGRNAGDITGVASKRCH
jgi:hypothetical protein